ncbi:MAG: hypothetical protein K2L87_02790, partial [Clostridiales bacterium]|nr:hypothetical protein [Clostridiales bacterium]
VTFDGSTYDFYTEAGKSVLLSDETQLSIVVTEISGKDTMRDAASYTVTVTPAGDYEWQDGTRSAVTFTFTVKPMEATVTWSVASSYVYNGTTEHKPTVTALAGNEDGTNVTFDITGGSINAGNYTATVTLGGTKAGNYTVSNNTQAFTVKKAVLTNPGLQQTVAFTRATQTFTVNGWATLNGKVSVTSGTKNVVDGTIADWSLSGDTLTLLHAGTYTFTFTINDANKNNYCWATADNEKFGAASVTALTQELVVTREQLKTPVLGASRALQLGSDLPLSDIAEADRKVKEIPYELSYGTYKEGSYTVGAITPTRGVTYFVRVATVNDGGKVSGTNYSVYDFEWIWDDTDTDWLNWVNNTAGAPNLDGTAFNLRFVYTKTLVSVTFELFGGTGYTFGENGTAGTYALNPTGLTLSGLPEWFTYAQDGNDKASYDAVTEANPSIGVKFYLSQADAEAERNEVTQLVNGLPWKA